MILLLWFCGVGLFQTEIGRFSGFFESGSAGIISTAGLVVVSYMGLTKVASVAEEVKNPERNLPLGMFLAFGTIVIPHVFHREGRPVRNMYKSWQKACDRVGVPAAWLHDMRRSAVRNLERAGVPQSTAMKLTGHKTASVYRRYAIADHEVLEEGVDKLAKLLGTPDKDAERRVLPIQN